MRTALLALIFCAVSFFAAAQKDSTNVRFEKVEIEADFKGGVSSWAKYLQKNMNSNVPVKNDAPIGKYQVIIRFIVSKTGKVSDVVAETHHGYGMEEEAIRIIKNSPDWEPARQGGRSVNAYRRQPITFMVQQEDVHIVAKDLLDKDKENIVLLTVNRVDNEDLELETDNGTIQYESGRKYILKPAAKGRAIVHIYRVKNNKRKKVAKASFPVN